MAKAKSNKKETSEMQKRIKEIADSNYFEPIKIKQSDIDSIYVMIKDELKPSHLKVVAQDEASIRIHAEFKDPDMIINLIV